MSAKVFKGKLCTCIVNYWNEAWHTSMFCTQTKDFFPYVNIRLTKQILCYSRIAFSIMIQLFAGHNWLRRLNSIVAHGHPQDDSGCICCDQDEESSFNIFAVCDKFAIHRMAWFGQDALDRPFNYSARQIMGFLRDALIEDLKEYE